jgi:peptidyl-prolyl cis-trans isomerase B (cyclophilin B)
VAPSKNTEREAREARERLRRYNARQTVHAHQVKRRTRDNVFALIGLVVIAALATVTQIYYFSAGPGMSKTAASASPSASPSATPTAAGQNVGAVPPATLGGNRTWAGTLTLNKKVSLGISLDGKKAPQGVSSVVNDIQTGFLDGKACWRLTNSPGFDVLQCGGSSGSDTGGAAYSFGPIENAPANGVYPAGSIVLANTGTPYGEGHQFFITYKTTTITAPAGIAGYSVVGQVTSGLSTLISDITSKGVNPKGGTSANDGPPNLKTTITSVTIK